MTEYNLNFMHPQYGTTMNVDIDAAFTIEEMINNLLLSGFISKNEAGYDFALMDKMLDRKATFSEIQELYDGAVIRIIAHKGDTAEMIRDNFILLHIKHPVETLILNLKINEKDPMTEVIQQASDKNFVQGGTDIIFHLQKGDKLLDLNKTVSENQVHSGDYLQIVQADEEIADPLHTAVNGLNEKMNKLQEEIETQLTNIKEALPAANMIPIDPTRAVNPTMQTYESIDTIVNRLLVSSKQEPLRHVRPFPTALVINLIVFLVFVVFVVLVLLKYI
jgi:hypothetical protein